MSRLPTLFKANSSGALLSWDIWTEGSTIITEFGQVGGKIQRTEDTIKVGKNVGKTNATTPESQAEAEALSKWEKQISKKGYIEDRERATAGESDLQGEECMLCEAYGTILNGVFQPDRNHKINFPAGAQPKLDGHRSRTKPNKTLWSRGHKPIEQVPHINEAIIKIFQTMASPKLDGELYNHELKEDFEKLTSILKQKKSVHPDHKLAQYHLYDIDEPGLNYLERYELLKDITAHSEYLKLVPMIIVNNHEEVMAAYKKFYDMGYEGLIIRNLDSEYVGKRTDNLQKLKEFMDDEFQITGIEEGKGKLQGHAASFWCVTKEGKPFKAKMEGDTAMLKKYFDDHSLWQGKILTVRFQNYTRKNRVPRFPVGLRFREDL